MKKFLTISLAALILLAAASCGDDKPLVIPTPPKKEEPKKEEPKKDEPKKDKEDPDKGKQEPKKPLLKKTIEKDTKDSKNVKTSYYNDKGQLVKVELNIFPEYTTTVYKYNDKGQLVGEYMSGQNVDRNDDDLPRYDVKEDHEYTWEDNLIRKSVRTNYILSTGEQMIETYTYLYNEKGLVYQIKSYNAWVKRDYRKDFYYEDPINPNLPTKVEGIQVDVNTPFDLKYYKYDDKGRLIEEISGGWKGRIFSKTIYKEFDSNGNWTRKETYWKGDDNNWKSSPEDIYTRTISYQ